jgi:Ca2+-binding EF-hand superfamily protein
MSRRILALAGLLALALPLLAADPPKGAAPARDADGVQSVVYLGQDRPVLLRLRVLVNGQPYGAAWDAFMKKLFDYLDVNGDGTLSKEEAARLPNVNSLRNHYSGIITFAGGGNNAAPFADLDANRDGKVTPDELRAYFRKNGFGSFQITGASGQGKSGALTDALFKQLDRNGDGKLSREELQAADEVLHRLDLDEDEMISEDELVADTNVYGKFVFAVNPNDTGGAANPAFQHLPPGESAARLAKTLLERYDKDKNGKLSRAESGFDEATFARADANKDGQLDAGELEKWLSGPGDLELTVRLGGLPAPRQPGGVLKAVVQAGRGTVADSAVEITPGKDWPLAAAARPQGDGVVLTHGVAQLTLRGDNSARFRGDARGFYIQQFKMALKDKKDYLTKADVSNQNFLSEVFAFADRDGDGKLTEKELNAFFDAIADGASASLRLAVADHGTGLFELIDANRDGRLSIRELRSAWERVAPWDKAQAGMVSREQLPRQYQLTVKQGMADDRRRVVVNVARYPGGQPPGGSGRGPLWFQKMDRNGDGDVSLREWLGSMEDFKKIDTDGDGLISLEEAQKADAWFRERLKDKK